MVQLKFLLLSGSSQTSCSLRDTSGLELHVYFPWHLVGLLTGSSNLQTAKRGKSALIGTESGGKNTLFHSIVADAVFMPAQCRPLGKRTASKRHLKREHPYIDI